MASKFFLSLLVIAAAVILGARPAEAAPRISPQNPYRSFNISGINYGSVRWEQSHRRGVSGFTNHRGLLFRRR